MISNTRRHISSLFFSSNNINLISYKHNCEFHSPYNNNKLAAAICTCTLDSCIYRRNASSVCWIFLHTHTHAHRRDIIVLSRDVCVSLPAQRLKVYIYTKRERDQDRSFFWSPFFFCVCVCVVLFFEGFRWMKPSEKS